jgi:hypothetical protein
VNGGTFLATAVADIDGDSVNQCWAFRKRDNTGAASGLTLAGCTIDPNREDQIHKASEDGIY